MGLRVAGYESCSTVDWYDKLAVVFFCSGCNFSCRYCHNWRLINPRMGNEWDSADITNLIVANEPIHNAIVFTGGEPTLQPDLYDICKAIKDDYVDYPIMIDTNGSNVELLYRLMRDKLIDRLAVDVKASLNPVAYESIIGVPAESHVSSLLVTLKWAKHYGVEVEARTTVFPTLDENDIDSICHRIRYYVDDYYLQECNLTDPLDPTAKELSPYDRVELMYFAATAKMAGMESVYIKTRERGTEHIYQ